MERKNEIEKAELVQIFIDFSDPSLPVIGTRSGGSYKVSTNGVCTQPWLRIIRVPDQFCTVKCDIKSIYTYMYHSWQSELCSSIP